MVLHATFSFLIKSSSKLLVTSTGIKAWTSSISGLWFPWSIYMFLEMRFDLGTLDSGERSLPFGLLVGFVMSWLKWINARLVSYEFMCFRSKSHPWTGFPRFWIMAKLPDKFDETHPIIRWIMSCEMCQVCTQTFEKGGANLRVFTMGGCES